MFKPEIPLCYFFPYNNNKTEIFTFPFNIPEFVSMI